MAQMKNKTNERMSTPNYVNTTTYRNGCTWVNK